MIDDQPDLREDTRMTRILIQSGHLAPREPGFESGTGTAHEAELALAIRTRLAALLRKDGRFSVTESPGDLPDGWTGDVALFLHGDGSGNPAASGYCFGYQTLQGGRLAAFIAGEFQKIPGHPRHRTDNYTSDLRGYYGFRHVNATSEVVIEHGFLTNPGERSWLFAHLDDIAAAEYRAVLAHLGMKAPAEKPVGFAPPWPVFADGKQIGAGRLVNPALVIRISTALRAAGKKPPYTARLIDGAFVATGKFWPPGKFTRAISANLRAGREITVDGAVTIKTRKA